MNSLVTEGGQLRILQSKDWASGSGCKGGSTSKILGHIKPPLINGEPLTQPECDMMSHIGWYGNPQQERPAGWSYRPQLQRLSEEDAIMRMRQSALHGNMQKAAEMTASAKKVAAAIEKWHWQEQMSLRDVAKKLSLSYSGLQWYLGRYKLRRKSRLLSLKDKFQGHGPNWTGGRVLFTNAQQQTYAYLFKPGHPNANTRGYVFEHRWIMAEQLGRPIHRNEVIHHVNGDSLDNRPVNLEVRWRGGKHQYHGRLMVCPQCGYDLLRQ